ncbi:MAG: hypothetical protein L3J69_08185 [Desulfobacula sp.]|nr:hypothetical protein [Desulfobacula sp.]
MSLSDRNDNQFQAFDVNDLESFDSEKENRDPRAKPDVERFKMLFEKTEFESGEENIEFQALYTGEKEEVHVVFMPMIEKEEESDKKSSGQPGPIEKASQSEPPDAVEPEETPEEIGYKDGFESGYADGVAQGLEQGIKEGFEKGEPDGHEKGEKQGFEEGEAKGLEQGRKIGEKKAEKETREKGIDILASLEDTLKTADTTLLLLVEKYEDRIISLIQLIARKAVLARLEIDDEIVKPMVLDALGTLVEPEQVELSVCEADYEYIEMVKDDFFEEIKSLENVSVKSDPTIKRGGCKIKTNTAAIETDPMARLDAIFEAIKRERVK